jgi:hypothetical protein
MPSIYPGVPQRTSDAGDRDAATTGAQPTRPRSVRASDEEEVGGVDPRGVELGNLDGSLGESQDGR